MNRNRILFGIGVLAFVSVIVTVRLGGFLVDNEYRQPDRQVAAQEEQGETELTPRQQGIVDEQAADEAEARARPYEEAEYRTVPFVGSRVTVWVLAQLHLLFAAFVLAVPLFAFIIEFVGYVKKEERYNKLAYEFTKLLSVSFSMTATFGAFLTFGLIILYPKFTNYLMHIFSPTFLPYVLLFFLEALFLYSYYYGWGKFGPKMHLFLGFMLNIVGTAIMFIANAWLTFMMSPGRRDDVDGDGVPDFVSAVSESGALLSLRDAFFNFTWMPINIHRIIANVAFGGSIAAAYAAFRYLQAKTDEEKAHFDWMGYVGNFVAIIAFLPLPFAGYYLAAEIYAFSQTLGIQMMGGTFSWLFVIQAALIGNLFLGANYYLWLGMGRMEGGVHFQKFIKWLLIAIALCFAVWATPRYAISSVSEIAAMGGSSHPQLSYLGQMSAKNTAVNILILSTYMSFLLYRRTGRQSVHPHRQLLTRAQAIVFSSAAALVIFYGVYGYYVDAAIRIRFAIPQVYSVLAALVVITVIDLPLYRNAAQSGETKWGRMPAVSQYALIFIALSFTWLMGLMGYVRSGLRQEWHVYGVILDTSPDAYTPTLGFATQVVSVTVLIFFGLLGVVFWLSSLGGKKDWEPKAVADGGDRLEGGQAA
ncbi:MAG: hypothetical protein F4X59_16755 [Holophagales bacterium]|nr:hypothetical protein [Holophagales bacterium]MXX61014.1 hypothetical protein [Holophagales bacterium]MYC11757.1 hypothetical protein [Holophagales bacterium]MYD22288.1 hypothetical protein [Holophagales bacterium]MYI34172.1 hypothetical protein [Holophagales bacterium]